MSEWNKEVEQARRNLEERSFVVELDRELPENTSLRIVEKLEKKNGKDRYKVISEEPSDCWY